MEELKQILKLLRNPQTYQNRRLLDFVYLFTDEIESNQIEKYLNNYWHAGSFEPLPLVPAYRFEISFFGLVKLLQSDLDFRLEINRDAYQPLQQHAIDKMDIPDPVNGVILKLINDIDQKNDEITKKTRIEQELLSLFVLPLTANKPMLQMLRHVNREDLKIHRIMNEFERKIIMNLIG